LAVSNKSLRVVAEISIWEKEWALERKGKEIKTEDNRMAGKGGRAERIREGRIWESVEKVISSWCSVIVFWRDHSEHNPP